jgi:hypothetical protein
MRVILRFRHFIFESILCDKFYSSLEYSGLYHVLELGFFVEIGRYLGEL